MNYRYAFAVVSTRTKKKALSGLLKGYMRSINPEVFDYEEEDGVLNCFASMEQAMRVVKELGKDKQVSILGFEIPVNCMVPRAINRKGHSKQYVADYVEQHFGVRNYLATLRCGEEEGKYLILTDLSCLLSMFDPDEEKGTSVQGAKPVMQEKKPEQTIKTAVRETFKDVYPQTGKETETPAWVLPSTGGVLVGFLMGIAASRIAQEHPVMTAAALPVGAAALGVAWMYKQSN